MTDSLVAVKVLDRTYKIKCRPDQAQDLHDSARYLDEQMKKMMQGSGSNSTDRVAIVAALNICHELMMIKKQKNEIIESMHHRIQDLHRRIENFLVGEEKVTL